MSAQNAVPEPVAALVAIFAEHLRNVSFPDVDAERLQSLVAALERSSEELAAAEAALVAAREAHDEAHQALKTAAQRGLAYAQVFASDDETLSAKLSAVSLSPASRQRKPPAPERKKRRAPPKPENLAELPFANTPPAKKVGSA